MGKMDEMILVVPRDILFENEKLTFQGTLSEPELVDKIGSNLERNFSSIRRGEAEEDPTLKQPIPYAVIRRGDKLFGYTRLEGGGEVRLHGKISLGVGGHMNDNPNLDSFKGLLLENLEREINEEINIKTESDYELNIVGFINDDSDEVGRVHLCILIVIDVDNEAEVTVRETNQLEGKWFTIDELLSDEVYSRLENWSQITVDTLK